MHKKHALFIGSINIHNVLIIRDSNYNLNAPYHIQTNISNPYIIGNSPQKYEYLKKKLTNRVAQSSKSKVVTRLKEKYLEANSLFSNRVPNP